MREDRRDFFISYNQADEQWAKWIAAVLEVEGYTTFLQAWDFRPGGNFVLDMHNALKQSERFIAVLSPDYLDSLYCQAEWAAAFTKDPNSEKNLFIPVRVTNIKPEGLHAAIIYIDLFGVGEDEETAKQHLLSGVNVKRVPRNRPSFPGTAKVRFPGSLPFNNLPYIRNGYFTGRELILKDIHDSLKNGGTISLTQVLTGLGGVGKTQTALEYAYRYASNYEWIWWIPAETESTVLTTYKTFAVKMQLLKADQQDSEMIIETVLNWMDSHLGWLFIYDNADSLASNTSWWPRNNRGNIIVTTRNRYNHIGKALDVSVFSKGEAVSFLAKRTGISGDHQKAFVLSKRLGYLPLALEQAAAYIRNNDCTYGEYIALLDEYKLELLEEMEGVINYEQPVTATWEISIRKINREAAQQLLYLCAHLAPENIEEQLFSENLKHLPLLLREGLSNYLNARKIWGKLAKYSLLQKQDSKSYSMHRLLQEVVRNNLKGDSQWARCVLETLCNTYDFEYGNVDSHNNFLRLSPHVEAFINASDLILSDEKEKTAHLCVKSGFGNFHLGNYDIALEWYKKALAIYKKVLGKEHPDTATIYNNIAGVYDRQGDYPKALELYKKALTICEKLQGKEHPDTATSYNNIASVYHSQGDYLKALELYEKALAICEKVLGKEHLDTAGTYNNIAAVYSRQGDYYPKALGWYKKALAIHEKVLGKEHPDTATSYNNIAGVYYRQGNYPKALEWFTKALAIQEKVLGKEHPDTATSYNNIGGVYYSQGDYPKALEWSEKALAIFEGNFSSGHPRTISIKKNIIVVKAVLCLSI